MKSINAAQLDQLLHPTLDPDAPSDGARQGPAGFAGRGLRRARVRRRRGGASQGARPHRDPRAGRDLAGGRARHACRGRHPHHPRRHDEPCGGGGARHGAAMRRRRRPRSSIDLERETLEAGGVRLGKGDIVTIDGSTGQIIKGRVPMREPELSEDFVTLMRWADSFRRMRVRANADTPADARAGARLRRRRHRALPHRAYVLRGGPHPRRCAR